MYDFIETQNNNLVTVFHFDDEWLQGDRVRGHEADIICGLIYDMKIFRNVRLRTLVTGAL